MCYTCGCKLPYENHGDKRNITEDMLVEAGKTDALKHAGRIKAKENMMELIKLLKDKGELDNPKKDYNS
jgi:hypothetical protein